MFHPPTNVPPPIIKTWPGNGWIYKSLIFPAISVDFPGFVGFRLPDDGDKSLSGCPVNIFCQSMAMLRWTMACSVMQIVDQITPFFWYGFDLFNNDTSRKQVEPFFFGTYCCRKQFSSFNRDARFAKLMSSLLRKGKQLPASAQKCRNLGSGWPGSTKWKLIGENPVVEPYSLYGLYIYTWIHIIYIHIYIHMYGLYKSYPDPWLVLFNPRDFFHRSTVWDHFVLIDIPLVWTNNNIILSTRCHIPYYQP